MIEFPSIGQYRNAIKAMHEMAAFVGLDERGNPIYKSNTAALPIVKYVGTVKLHGSNASVVQTPDGVITYQSRNRVITPEKDNAGFATFCQKLETYIPIDSCEPVSFWSRVFLAIRKMYDLKETVVIYGEWCCGNIQQGVALSQIPEKRFIIFGIANAVGEEITRWISPNELSRFSVSDLCERVHCIYEYKTFEMTIDFNNPALTQNQLVELTLQVEKECPVAERFGISGTGEGIVWRPVDSVYSDPRLWFKVKGDEHSVSKVKTLAEVDVEKLNSVKEFVEAVVSDNRCRQGIEYLKEMDKPLDQTSTGIFLSWMIADIVHEESDRIAASGLKMQEINKQVGIQARQWFFKWLENNF